MSRLSTAEVIRGIPGDAFRSAKHWWQQASNRGRGAALTVIAALLCLIVLPFIGGDNAVEVDPAEQAIKQVTHPVQSGEYLIAIANEHGVPWQSVAVVNQAYLDRLATERCGKLADRYTKSSRRKGHYCNETLTYRGQHMVSLNSLQPGDELVIPLSTHPVIDRVIAQIPGKRIVVVIDDTGSMTNDQKLVSAWYMRAISDSGKDIVGVVLYADGYVREYTDMGNVEFHTTGGVENTRHALETAAAMEPDAIVLVSDEPGDDWDRFRGLRLPPVYAHSLEIESHENLERVASLTGGVFMRPPLHGVAN